MHNALIALPAVGQLGSPQSSPWSIFVYMGLMIGLFYVILIRPQQRREKERRALLETIKSGDRVVFSGGIIGIVAGVKDRTFSIKIADNVRIEVGRAAVTQVIPKGEAPTEEDGK